MAPIVYCARNKGASFVEVFFGAPITRPKAHTLGGSSYPALTEPPRAKHNSIEPCGLIQIFGCSSLEDFGQRLSFCFQPLPGPGHLWESNMVSALRVIYVVYVMWGTVVRSTVSVRSQLRQRILQA